MAIGVIAQRVADRTRDEVSLRTRSTHSSCPCASACAESNRLLAVVIEQTSLIIDRELGVFIQRIAHFFGALEGEKYAW